MRTIYKQGILITGMLLLIGFGSQGQQTYQYLLKENFHALQTGAPVLVQVPNNESLTGEFTTQQVPATTCGQEGNAPGYFFEDDAGLLFRNPSDFIGQEYTIAFNFHFDEFISPPAWVRVMSFTHYDDVGLYIHLTDPPNHGTLEFWPYGEAGTYDFFNTVDYYQMILVRNAAGMITVYVNGSSFAQYDDSYTQAYVPQDTTNFIIWFRDDPSVLAGEASPGFVSDIRISNFPWSTDQVQAAWNAFCSSLLGINHGLQSDGALVYPNPAGDKLYLDLPRGEPVDVEFVNLTGQVISKMENCTGLTVSDISAFQPGIYLVRINGKDFQKTCRFTRK